MFSIGIRGRFGNYDHHELSLARQKQDFGNILTRIRTTRSDEASGRLLSADQSQDHGRTSQTALESRQAGIPLSRLDSSGSPSRQDTSSSAELSGIDKTRELVRLILDSDDIKRNLVASEFLTLTDAQFQDILDEAAAILRNRETLHDRTRASHSSRRVGTRILTIMALLSIMYFSTFHMIGISNVHEHEALNEKNDRFPVAQYFLLFLGSLASVGVMHVSSHIHACDALASRGEKIRKLRNQFQEFCASIRESGLRRASCTDTPCSISKESITRFFTHTGLASAVVVGTGIAIAGIAPCLDALNSADEAVHLWNELSSVDTGNFTSQQTQNAVWWVHFSGTYVCNLAVPLVFMANIFSGLKQDVMELFGGARCRNEHVRNTVHNLRALLARLLQDDNIEIEKFVEDLMHQKHIGSPELMLMDYASKMEPDANALEMSGVTRDVLSQHGLERADLAVFCSKATQVMDALPDREINPAEALELINDLRFDVSFRNKVLNGLKFEDAAYNDRWVRFVGGARTLARLSLGWLAMNSLSGTFSSNMIVRHYRNAAGIAAGTTLTCASFANKTITPFDTIRFQVGTASAAAQGIALGNAAMNTLDTGWIILMAGYSSITAGTRILPGLRTTTVSGTIREFLSSVRRQRPEAVFSTALGTLGTIMYLYSLSCQNSNDVIMLRECPHLSDIPDSPITDEYRGSCRTYATFIAAVLPLPLISDWNHILSRSGLLCSTVANRNANSNKEIEDQSQQGDIEQRQETASSVAAAMNQQADFPADKTVNNIVCDSCKKHFSRPYKLQIHIKRCGRITRKNDSSR